MYISESERLEILQAEYDARNEPRYHKPRNYRSEYNKQCIAHENGIRLIDKRKYINYD